MSNVVKRAVGKGRSLLSGNVLQKVETLTATQVALQSEQRAIAAKVVEINERVANSGSIQLSPHEIVAKIFTGVKIYLDPHDISVVPHLALDGIWEGDISNAWLSLVRPQDTVIDIGANFGYYGLLAAQRTEKKHSKVIFFEANPKLIPYIRKTLGVNWLNEQSVIENLAVSDKEGEVSLTVLKDFIGSSSLHSADYIDSYMHEKMYVETAETVKVQATTIDAYAVAHDIKAVDLIKMDIEGLEEQAYKGMRKTIKASPEVTLFVEFTKDSYTSPQKFYEQMVADFGHVYKICPGGRLEKYGDTAYDQVIGTADDWVMPVFSKRADLASKQG